MCRNIRPLFNFAPPTTEAEVQAAARQYVRKVTGMTRPSAANTAAFEAAVAEIASITRRLVLSELHTTAAPRDRDTEAAKAKVRGQQREARIRQGPPAGPLSTPNDSKTESPIANPVAPDPAAELVALPLPGAPR